MTLKTRDLASILLAAIVMSGCASSVSHAPVSDRVARNKKPVAVSNTTPATAPTRQNAGDQDWRPQSYIVQKGDTLYAIAFNYGLDYHDLAELNNIQNPDVIKVGQELRLFAAGTAAQPSVAATPVQPALYPEIQVVPLDKALPSNKPANTSRTPGIPVIAQPLAVKLPYSATAAAQIAAMQGGTPPPVAAASASTGPVPKPVATAVAPPVVAVPSRDVADDDIEWAMPTSGRIISGFQEGENRKGIDVAGKVGQPILASAAGKVVYSGSGLRGYGKLIIIKHNKTYLSAYAHNDRILVKEGQVVTKGQKIAEMGNDDAQQAALHFEIRKLGKPVDPAKYLPLIKS